MHCRFAGLMAATGVILLPAPSPAPPAIPEVPKAIAVRAGYSLPAPPAIPEVPKAIAVPAGYSLLLKVEGRGVQIYKAVEGKSGKQEWVLEAPLADLLDDKGGKAGWHYEGPAWEAADGSKVVRDKSEDVKSAPAPDAKNDIPWLLVKVKAEDGKDGTFRSAVYIQRLQTAGGKPPAELPGRAGGKVGVAYKAVYFFYGKAK